MSKQSQRRRRQAQAKRDRMRVQASSASKSIDKAGNHEPEHAGTEAQSRQSNKRFSTNEIVVGVLNIVGGLVFAHFSQALFSTGHPDGGLWCSCGGVVMGLILLSIIAAHIWTAKKWLIVKTCVVAILTCVVGFGLWTLLNSEPRARIPKLVVQLESPDFPGFFLPLTKDIYPLTEESPESASLETSLVLPVTGSNLPAPLRLTVVNASSVEADGYKITVALSDDLEMKLGTDWEPLAKSGVDGTRGASHQNDRKFFGREQRPLTDIAVTHPAGWVNPPPKFKLVIRVDAGGADSSSIVLGLLCPVVPEPTKPELVPKNAVWSRKYILTNAP